MKFKVTFAAMALCLAVSSQSFGFDLLDRMLGGSGCGCDTSCCGTPEPSCGCDGIGIIRGRFFNRGCGSACDTGCDKGCEAKACDTGCNNGCAGSGLLGRGMNRCCRPKLLSFDVKCLSIPVIIPKITLPKIQLPRPCIRSCGCDNGCGASGCDNGCGAGCAKAEPSCGCDKGCKPVISVKLNRCGLLDRMKCRPKLFNKCGCKSSCGCEPACGTDYAAPANKADAPKPQPEKKDMTSNSPVPPAPVVDPAAFGGIQATPISDVN